jgi:hypothetical protein
MAVENLQQVCQEKRLGDCRTLGTDNYMTLTEARTRELDVCFLATAMEAEAAARTFREVTGLHAETFVETIGGFTVHCLGMERRPRPEIRVVE